VARRAACLTGPERDLTAPEQHTREHGRVEADEAQGTDGAAAGGGLLVAFSLLPRRFDSPLDPLAGEHAFDAWLKIGRDGVVTVAVPQLEMGQGITTLLPQVVAMELGADWRQVAVEPAPVSGAYANLPLAAHWAPLWRPSVPALAASSPTISCCAAGPRRTRFSATAEGHHGRLRDAVPRGRRFCPGHAGNGRRPSAGASRGRNAMPPAAS
jgi:hypothetical protein